MDILPGARQWPSILLARTTDTTDASTLAADQQGSWRAWRKAVGSMSPEEVISQVTDSGLRGRGGAGFPTGDKWAMCAAQPPGIRYAVANGFEADPGTQLDRTLMERDPHAVLEGLALAAYAVGAHEAFVVIKASSSTATRRIRAALRAAEEAGLLGRDAAGSGYDLHIEVREVQGAHVIGEETVLLRALEDKRAQPDQRPPYPAEDGLWGRPTVVNNVETLAAVPWIVATGPDEFRKAGSAAWPGTTLVQVSGAVKHPGIAEVPMGTRLGDIIKLAGGAAGTLKAALVGGPSGGFLPPAEFDVPLEPTELEARGADLGVRVDRRRRRWRVHRRHGQPADPFPQRRGVRQDHPVPHRSAQTGRDRGPDDDRASQADRHRPADRPFIGHTRRGSVRPGGVGPQPADERDAILRSGVRGPHRAGDLPGGRLPTPPRGRRSRPVIARPGRDDRSCVLR